MDKEVELQKAAVLNSYLEADVNVQFSFLAGGLIGILVLLLTLFYEGVFDVFGGRLLGLVPFAIVLIGLFYAFNRILRHIKDQQTKYLSLIFDLISSIEKGEPLPSLPELKIRANQKKKE